MIPHLCRVQCVLSQSNEKHYKIEKRMYQYVIKKWYIFHLIDLIHIISAVSATKPF